jgi:hypothetical protein
VGSLDADDMRVAGAQRARMPAFELGAVSEGDAEQLALVAVADIAGGGSQARLVRLAVTLPIRPTNPPKTSAGGP